jgi:triosephosphate isomerase
MNPHRQTLVAGNWKMNGSLESVKTLVNGILAGMGEVQNAAVAVCPPFIYIPIVAPMLAGSKIALGAQNVSKENPGAFTGEIAAPMLKDFGCEYVIVGHSERRTLNGETDTLVAEKFVRAQKEGLTPIRCVGELLEEREAGKTEEVVARQLDAVITLAGVGALGNAVIAYEPVWAIGTGKTASKEQAQEAHAFIRGELVKLFGKNMADGIRIQYGGSVKPDNVAELMAQPDVDGALVGGASLNAESFEKIVKFRN